MSFCETSDLEPLSSSNWSSLIFLFSFLFFFFLSKNARSNPEAVGRLQTLTAPHRDAPALQLAHDGAHGPGDWDGVKVGGVRRHGQDGRLRRRDALPLHADPVESSAEPHGAHDHAHAHVHQPDGGAAVEKKEKDEEKEVSKSWKCLLETQVSENEAERIQVCLYCFHVGCGKGHRHQETSTSWSKNIINRWVALII